MKFLSLRRAREVTFAAAALLMISSTVLAQGVGRAGGASAEDVAKLKAMPTPRAANGKPDLSGYWGAGGGPSEFGTGKNNVSADGKTIEFQIPPPFAPRAGGAGGATAGGGGRRGGNPEAMPAYKPDLEEKVKYNATHDVDTDNTFGCGPAGVPRAGAPQEIFQSKDAVVFLYSSSAARVIPTDGRAHDPMSDASYHGDSVGHWQGDTLIVDAVNFTDETWMASGGRFHSDNMHVVERLTRQGNTLVYEAEVQDPDVLTKSWVTSRTIPLGHAGAHVIEGAPCHERDRGHMIDKTHITP